MTNEERYLKEIANELKQLNKNITKIAETRTAGYKLYKRLQLMRLREKIGEKSCRTCQFYDDGYCHQGMRPVPIYEPEVPCEDWEPLEGGDQNE